MGVSDYIKLPGVELPSFDSLKCELIDSYTDGLIEEVKANILSPGSELLKFNESQLITSIQKQLSSVLGLLPDVSKGDDLNILLQKSIETLQLSYVVQIKEANDSFNKSFEDEMWNLSNWRNTFTTFAESYWSHIEDLAVLASIGAVGGTLAFVVGTVVQIIIDIFNAFIMIIKYAYYGISYVVDRTSEAFQNTFTAIDPKIVESMQEPFDLDRFLSEDLYEMMSSVSEMAMGIIDSYIDNAEKWGKSVASFVHYGIANSVETVTSLMFETYNYSWNVLEKMWWGVRQWYKMGQLFGPLIVDIVLLFCSGGTSGVISAASKIGKLSKVNGVSKAFRFTKWMDKLEKIDIYKDIIAKIPDRLIKLVKSLVERLWAAIGHAIDKIKGWIESAYKIAANKDLPPLEEVLESFQKLYDRVEGVNFFIFIITMLAGGTIDSKGQMKLA